MDKDIRIMPFEMLMGFTPIQLAEFFRTTERENIEVIVFVEGRRFAIENVDEHVCECPPQTEVIGEMAWSLNGQANGTLRVDIRLRETLRAQEIAANVPRHSIKIIVE